jgi:hypothetical protein
MNRKIRGTFVNWDPFQKFGDEKLLHEVRMYALIINKNALIFDRCKLVIKAMKFNEIDKS